MGKYKMQNRSSLPNGYQLNQYKIEKFLGQGGFGIAYLAKEIASNKKVVIKESFSKHYVFRGDNYGVVLENNISLSEYRKFLDKFFLEAKIINSINHPNIVRVIDSFEAKNTAYFVMEYIEGESLLNYIQRNGSLSLHQIYLIIAPLLQGLKEVHKKGYIHRDISPDNILIQPNGVPIVIDFGISKNIELMGSNSSNSIVKNGYSPFEQYSKTEKPKASMDIYALGATLFLMMAKQVPTSAVERQNALNNHKIDPLELDLLRWRTKKYSKLVSIIKKAMAFNSQERYQSIEELQRALFEEGAKKSFFTYLKELISTSNGTIKVDVSKTIKEDKEFIIEPMVESESQKRIREAKEAEFEAQRKLKEAEALEKELQRIEESQKEQERLEKEAQMTMEEARKVQAQAEERLRVAQEKLREVKEAELKKQQEIEAKRLEDERIERGKREEEERKKRELREIEFEVERLKKIEFEKQNKREEEAKRQAELERQRREEIVIIDGLMYQNQPFTKEYNWEDAKKYAKNLRLGGYDDWRLPTRDELKKLLTLSKNKNSKGKEYYIRKEFVENLESYALFWSITEYNNSSSYAWRVRFYRGRDGWYGKSDELYALCVRGQ